MTEQSPRQVTLHAHLIPVAYAAIKGEMDRSIKLLPP